MEFYIQRLYLWNKPNKRSEVFAWIPCTVLSWVSSLEEYLYAIVQVAPCGKVIKVDVDQLWQDKPECATSETDKLDAFLHALQRAEPKG